MRYKCQLYRRIVIRSFEVCCFYCSTVFPTLEWYRHACRWLIVDLQPKPALYVVKLEGGGGHEWWHKWAKVHWVIRAGFNFLLPFLPFIWFILFTSLPWAYFCTLVCFHGLQPWRTFYLSYSTTHTHLHTISILHLCAVCSGGRLAECQDNIRVQCQGHWWQWGVSWQIQVKHM